MKFKEVAAVLSITPATRPKFDLSGPEWVMRQLEIRKHSTADFLGDDAVWSLDQTFYAVRWHITTGLATTDEDAALARISPYRFLALAVDVTNEVTHGSVNARVDSLRSRLAR